MPLRTILTSALSTVQALLTGLLGTARTTPAALTDDQARACTDARPVGHVTRLRRTSGYHGRACAAVHPNRLRRAAHHHRREE
ncbi:hypothetical protein H3146_08670 [Streptomyces sp. OF3]|uniref:Uncharacterized protein n=1 Tax=Streptomyces alkaliterrae TaxID=2213162 RepID=A0A7W3WJN0_9ACTN|nr:hypothetical protein [Streptomyces alkaliterrae]MBB1253445.1 hypothetical protein [Streptomyces alkaliterrae]